MRIRLNLAVLPSSRERYALAGAIPVALVGLAAAVWLSASAARSSRDYLSANRERLRLQAEQVDLSEKEKDLTRQLEQPSVQSVFRSLHFINAAMARKRISVTGLTEAVTRFLPKGTRLTSLGLAPEGGNLAVRIVLAGRTEEALEDFLIKLEDSPDFKDVAIINQGFEESGDTEAPVTLTCVAHYVR